MKTAHRYLLASLLTLVLLCGCAKVDLRKEIIGQWDCTNFNWNQTRAINDAVKFTMVFMKDGTCVSFWTDTVGARYMEFTNRFRLLGGKVWLENENVVFRAKIKGDSLTLFAEKNVDAQKHGGTDDVSNQMTFHRLAASSSAPRKQ